MKFIFIYGKEYDIVPLTRVIYINGMVGLGDI